MDALFARWKAADVVLAEAEADPAARERYDRSMELVQRTIFEAFMVHRRAPSVRPGPRSRHARVILGLPRDERGHADPVRPASGRRPPGLPARSTVAPVAECVEGRLSRGLRPGARLLDRLHRRPRPARRIGSSKIRPMHPQCAEYAARICPFIAGSEDEVQLSAAARGGGPGSPRRPEHGRSRAPSAGGYVYLSRAAATRLIQKYGEQYIEATPWANVKTGRTRLDNILTILVHQL